MSFMRWGYPLTYFKKGESSSYVYSSSIKDGKIEDYDDAYENNESFVELIGTFIRRETGDEEYAWKIVRILAKKLGIEDNLREKPLDTNGWLEEYKHKYKETKHV